MPEHAELRHIAKYINLATKNKTYQNVIFGTCASKKCDLELPAGFPKTFGISVHTRGKELMFCVDTDSSHNITFTMGMTGHFFASPKKHPFPKHSHLIFVGQSDNLCFVDPRKFGTWRFGSFDYTNRSPDPVFEHNEWINKIESNFGCVEFSKPLCEVLLNQRYFNGVGNYLRSTILYYLDENPFQTLNNLMGTSAKCELYKTVKECCTEAYTLGGGQLYTWKNPIGEANENLFKDWVYYKKGLCCIDATDRRFWFSPKWEKQCPYGIINTNKVWTEN